MLYKHMVICVTSTRIDLDLKYPFFRPQRDSTQKKNFFFEIIPGTTYIFLVFRISWHSEKKVFPDPVRHLYDVILFCQTVNPGISLSTMNCITTEHICTLKFSNSYVNSCLFSVVHFCIHLYLPPNMKIENHRMKSGHPVCRSLFSNKI